MRERTTQRRFSRANSCRTGCWHTSETIQGSQSIWMLLQNFQQFLDFQRSPLTQATASEGLYIPRASDLPDCAGFRWNLGAVTLLVLYNSKLEYNGAFG